MAVAVCVQGVDWRDKSNWGCNAGMNPYLEYMNDGISLVWAPHISFASIHACCTVLLESWCTMTCLCSEARKRRARALTD